MPEEKPALCELCGEPMPPGEQMFKFHGYSGPCPKPPKARKDKPPREDQQPRLESKPASSYDLGAYLEADDEGRLRMLVEAYGNAESDRQRAFYEGQMMGITIDMDQHPEWFQHGCLCAECRSYGDS